MDRSRPTINIDCKAESIRKKRILCVWWNWEGVIYYELFKPGETVNADRYRQQLVDLNHALLKKRPQYKKRQDELILLHKNTPVHKTKPVRETLEALS